MVGGSITGVGVVAARGGAIGAAAVGGGGAASGGAIGMGGGPIAIAVGSPDIILENITGSMPGGTGVPAAAAASTISAGVGSTVPVIQLYPGGPEDVCDPAPIGDPKGSGPLGISGDPKGSGPLGIAIGGGNRPGNPAPGGGPAITLGDSVGAGPPTVTGGAMLGVIDIIISQIEMNPHSHMMWCREF